MDLEFAQKFFNFYQISSSGWRNDFIPKRIELRFWSEAAAQIAFRSENVLLFLSETGSNAKKMKIFFHFQLNLINFYEKFSIVFDSGKN